VTRNAGPENDGPQKYGTTVGPENGGRV